MALRMERAAATAAALAAWLAAHPLVRRVNYPGLPGHAGAAVHAGQATSGGSLLSFETGRCFTGAWSGGGGDDGRLCAILSLTPSAPRQAACGMRGGRRCLLEHPFRLSCC
jgi:hypothetical protein